MEKEFERLMGDLSGARWVIARIFRRLRAISEQMAEGDRADS